MVLLVSRFSRGPAQLNGFFIFWFFLECPRLASGAFAFLECPQACERRNRQHNVFFAYRIRKDNHVVHAWPTSITSTAPHERRVLPALRVPKCLPLWYWGACFYNPLRTEVDAILCDYKRERVSVAIRPALPAIVAFPRYTTSSIGSAHRFVSLN